MEEENSYQDDVEDIDYEEEDDDDEVEETSSGIIELLRIFSKWFIRIGMGIAVLLFLYFLFTFQFLSILLFAIGLVVSYFFGYFFMFCLDTFLAND